jgi:hypothetical protein
MNKYRALQRRFNNQHNSGARDEAAISLSAEQILETLENSDHKNEAEAMGGHILAAARAHMQGRESTFYGSTVEAYFKEEY